MWSNQIRVCFVFVSWCYLAAPSRANPRTVSILTGVSEDIMHAYSLFAHVKMVTKLAKTFLMQQDIVILDRDNKDLYERVPKKKKQKLEGVIL